MSSLDSSCVDKVSRPCPLIKYGFVQSVWYVLTIVCNGSAVEKVRIDCSLLGIHVYFLNLPSLYFCFPKAGPSW